jgi:hypothetical protein
MSPQPYPYSQQLAYIDTGVSATTSVHKLATPAPHIVNTISAYNKNRHFWDKITLQT